MSRGDIFLIWDSENDSVDGNLANTLAGIRQAMAQLEKECPGLQFHYSPAQGDPWEHVAGEVIENLMVSEIEIFNQLRERD